MPHVRRTTVFAVVALVVGGLLLTVAQPASASRSARAALIDTNGNPGGQVTFTTTGGTTYIEARIRIPSVVFEGFHGFHVHAVGVCDPKAVDAAGVPTPFFTAGGHHSETPQGHRSHDGDMPSAMVLRDGPRSCGSSPTASRWTS